MNIGAARLAEAIRADEGLARLMSQVFSAENRSALKAAGAQLRSFADQLRTFADQLRAAWAPLLEGLRPLARNIAAVLSVPRAGDYEALLIELAEASRPEHRCRAFGPPRRRLRSASDRAWLRALRGADPVHLGDHHTRELGPRLGRAASRAW